VGGPIAVAPFMRYLRAKLGEVYGLDLATATPPNEGTTP
jgi:hypothetical protein